MKYEVFNKRQVNCVDVVQVRSRGLPDDHAGPIRIIDIEGIDANMCCGTHVTNLSHLQVNTQVKSPQLTGAGCAK